jgi:hypothetical protein
MTARVLLLAGIFGAVCACQSPEVVGPRPIWAYFKNDTGRPILLWFWTGSGGFSEMWFDLRPGEAVSVPLEGPINVVTATNKSAKISLKHTLPPRGSGRFFDAQKSLYYYRVLRDRIEPVFSRDAKGWRIRDDWIRVDAKRPNHALQLTADRREAQLQFMNQFSMFTQLGAVSGS